MTFHQGSIRWTAASSRTAWVSLLALALACCGADEVGEDGQRNTPAIPIRIITPQPDHDAVGRSFTPPAESARRPRITAEPSERSVRALPDGDLSEWGTTPRWIGDFKPVKGAEGGRGGWTGAADLKARAALASYEGGLSLAVEVQDDHPHRARFLDAMERSDHLEVELWPGEGRGGSPPTDPLLGIRFKLGTHRQLIQMIRPRHSWREAELSSAGVPIPGGYLIEARVPLSVLTPLPAARLTSLHYRLTLHETDEEGVAAMPTLRAEGSVKLDPAMTVPEAVRKRPSVRICMAAEEEALWGYKHGWRCAVPYPVDFPSENDADPPQSARLGYARMPTPPVFTWLRERLIFVNIEGAQRSVAALLDQHETILSLLSLGVVGRKSPGNPWTKNSDARSIELPDGVWAAAVTHAYPIKGDPASGRCLGASRVYLSIIALRGALKSTPFKPAPEPESPPYLEEILRILVADCTQSVFNGWRLSKDRARITVRNLLHPDSPAVEFDFREGRYRQASPHPAAGQH